jgi:hypothetical protein
MHFSALCCLVFTSSAATVAAACEKQSANVIQSQLSTMGRVEPAAFRWSKDTQSMPDQMRAHLMESYAKADACLNGKPRVINFYVGPKLIGHVDAKGFFVPSDPAYDLPARARSTSGFKQAL